MFPGTLRWSKTWAYKLVSLACSALLDLCEATTLWNASPGKGLELCLTRRLLRGSVEWHCHVQSSSGEGTEGFHSRQKSSSSYSVHVLKSYLDIYNLMAINIFSWDLGRLPSRCRGICKKMLRGSIILGNTVGYFTVTHCKVSGLNQTFQFYCKWGENTTNNYSLYHKKCRDKHLTFRHVNQIRWIWPYISISASSFTMKQALLYNYKEKNKNLSSRSNHVMLISLLDFSLRFLLISFLISSNFFHDFGTHMTQMQ